MKQGWREGSVKCLSCNHEGLSSNPRNPIVITVFLPEERGGEMGILVCSQTSKLDIHGREQERPCLKTESME